MVSWGSVKDALESTKRRLLDVQPSKFTISIQPLKLGIRNPLDPRGHVTRLKDDNDIFRLDDLESESQQSASLSLPCVPIREGIPGMACAENFHARDGRDSMLVECDLNIAAETPLITEIDHDGAWCGLWFMWGVVRQSITRHLCTC